MPTNSNMQGQPPTDDVSYCDILTAIVQRFVRLVGAPAALSVARRVDGLSVDDDGRVYDYDRGDPIRTVQQLIDEYGSIFGDIAAATSLQAVKPRMTRPHMLQDPDADLQGLPPIRVLLVDDQVLFRSGIAQMLDAQPDIVSAGEAGTVQEAVAKCRELRPDIVLMDISLPDGTGFDATVSILNEMPETKIVFLTVHEDDDSLFAAIRAGGQGFLSKNMGAMELAGKLRGVSHGEAAISPGIARRILEEFSRLPPSSPANQTLVELTDREIEIVRALARGATNRDIASRLVITENTVKHHVQNVLTKLHLHSRREVIDYARRHGLIPPSGNTSA